MSAPEILMRQLSGLRNISYRIAIKYINWSDCIPLRLVVKRSEYIKSLKISKGIYRKL